MAETAASRSRRRFIASWKSKLSAVRARRGGGGGAAPSDGTGNTQLVFDPKTGKTIIVDLSKASGEQLRLIEQGRIRTLQERATKKGRVYTTLRRQGKNPKVTGNRIEWKEGDKNFIYQGGTLVSTKGATKRLKIDPARVRDFERTRNINRISRATGITVSQVKSQIAMEKLNRNQVKIFSTPQKQKRLEDIARQRRGGTISEKKFKSVSEELAVAQAKAIGKLSQPKVPVAQKVFTGTVVLGAIGAARGLNNIYLDIKDPRRVVSGLKKVFTQPLTVVAGVGKQFALDPVGTVAEFIVYSKTLGGLARMGKRSPVGRYVAEELYIRAQPVELRKPVRAIIKSAKAQEKINPSTVKNIPKVDFIKVKNLTTAEAKAVAKAIRETDSVVFGSLAGKTLGRRSKLPQPKDVDLATKNIGEFNQSFIKNLPKSLRKNYLIKKQSIRRRLNNEKLFDIKPLNRLLPQRSLLTRRGFLPVAGFVRKLKFRKGSVLPVIKKKPGITALEFPTQKFVKVKGIKLIGFGEQTVRKALGTLDVLISKNIRRAKDPQGFIISLEIQLSALKKASRKSKFARLRNKGKIKTIANALKVLKSKAFARLLEKKIKGITKEFPLVAKISVPKLKAINLVKIRQAVAKKVRLPKARIPKARLSKQERKRLARRTILKARRRKRIIKLPKRRPSKLPKKRPSKIPPSKLPKRRPSKLPSKMPRKRPSRVPSKLPRKKPSRIPSKIPKKKPSRVPSKVPSKVPSRVPSRVPSKVPSRVPSRVPSKVPSRVPSKVPGRVPPRAPPKTPPIPRLLTWKTKLPKGYVPMAQTFVRIKGKNVKLGGKMTTNRATLRAVKFIDKRLSRSFELKIVGAKKAKDIKRINLKKFRLRKGRDPRVLKFVEKSKYALDSKTEKILIQRARKRKSK